MKKKRKWKKSLLKTIWISKFGIATLKFGSMVAGHLKLHLKTTSLVIFFPQAKKYIYVYTYVNIYIYLLLKSSLCSSLRHLFQGSFMAFAHCFSEALLSHLPTTQKRWFLVSFIGIVSYFSKAPVNFGQKCPTKWRWTLQM